VSYRRQSSPYSRRTRPSSASCARFKSQISSGLNLNLSRFKKLGIRIQIVNSNRAAWLRFGWHATHGVAVHKIGRGEMPANVALPLGAAAAAAAAAAPRNGIHIQMYPSFNSRNLSLRSSRACRGKLPHRFFTSSV
jgi:hypothetical protein